MRFSQRIGKTPVRQALQVESIDLALKNRVWNIIQENFFDKLDPYAGSGSESQLAIVCAYIWKEFFEKPINDIPSYQGGGVYTIGFMNYLRDWYFKAQWFQIYDLVEFIAQLNIQSVVPDFVNYCNYGLEKEASGYRIVKRSVVKITSEEEINEIEEALETREWKSVNTHLKAALEYLSDRKSPNYRNSIKESISAVESLCIIIVGDKNATLGKALSIIERKYKMHNALKSAFSSLYGYTSDSGGIRHSLLEDDIEVTFEDAKFMLVSCSAFINYLKVMTGRSK
ncbi:MAG: hypothetical protein ICV83_16890 [Cytophagales bacterium]|nr:hypothetical protein [Cytophagales bacterium]